MRALLTLTLAASLLGGDELFGQRGRRREGRRRTAPAQAPKKTPPKKATEKPAPDPIAYTNAVIHVGNTTVLRRGMILTRGSKIEAVGHKLNLPPKTKVVDCEGMHVCPGFVIFDLSGVGASGRPGKGESYRDSIDPFNGTMKRALAAGITSYLTQSSRSGSAPAGPSAVIKCLPESLDGVIVKEPVMYGMSVPGGPSDWLRFEETLEKIKKYDKDKAEYDKKKAAGDKKAKAPRKPPSYDELKSIIAGKTKLRLSGGGMRFRGGAMPRFGGGGGGMGVKAIRGALRIAKELGIGVTLDNATEAWIVADEIAATGSSVILQPRNHSMPDPKRDDPHGSSIHACSILSKAGVPVAVLPPGGMFGSGMGTGGILGRDLNTPTVDPCFAIRGGMDEREALSTITLYPAMMMGVDDRIGSLEDGKDADLLILDGDPLHYKTFVQTAIVNGKVVYEKNKEPFYRHIRPRDSVKTSK